MSLIRQYSRNMVAEFLGTMGLIMAAIGSILMPELVWGSTMAYEFVFINALAVGFILFALIETLGPLSGAYFNPAVTLAQLYSKEISSKKAALYILAQLSGALFGVLLVNAMFYDTTQALVFVSENERATLPTFLSEFVCTFLLVAVIYGCVRGRSRNTSLAVGLFVGGMIVTSSSTMYANPAVDLARIFTNAACGIAPMSSLAFVLASILGALTAALVFDWLYPTKLDNDQKCDPFDCSRKESASQLIHIQDPTPDGSFDRR